MVPPVNTTAHGEADFMVHHKKHKKEKTDTVTYNITLFDVDHLVEVDMRQAPPGAPGDKIATLYGPEMNGMSQVSTSLHLICQDEAVQGLGGQSQDQHGPHPWGGSQACMQDPGFHM